MMPTIRCRYTTEGGDRCVLTDEHDGEHRVDGEPEPFQHGTDGLIRPYLMCGCRTCRDARAVVNL